MPLTRNLRIRRLHSSKVRAPTIPCSFPDCKRSFINNSGLTHHIRKQHSCLRHRSSASPISPPSSPPVVSPVRRRVGTYSSPSEISSPGNPNVTPLNSRNITATPLSSPNITPLNSPILPINSPFDFGFPLSPPVQDGHSIDSRDGDRDVDQQWPAGLPLNPNQGHENPVPSQLTKTQHSIINGTKGCSLNL